MKKSWIVLFALFLVSVVAAANVAAQDQVTIRVGSWESGDALVPWNNAIAAFEAEHPNIDVVLEAVPQEYGTKLLADFASGNAPDIFMTGDGDVAKFQSLGATENLDPFIDGENGFDRSIIFPGVDTFGDVAGSTYYLTKDFSPLVLYYNADHFAAAGLDTPTSDWTWDDLLNAAKELTLDGNGNNANSPDFDASNIQRWGIQIPNSWGDVVWSRGVLPLFYQNGGAMIAPDGSTMDGYLNSAESVDAFQWYADLFSTYHVAPAKVDVDSFAGVDMFANELVSMLYTGVWPLSGYIEGDDALSFSFGTSGLPAGPAGHANALCWSGFAMYSGSENKDAAWEFLKYIATGDGSREFAANGLPPVQAIAEENGLIDDPYYGPVMADLANVQSLPEAASPFWAECGNAAFVEQFTNIFASGISVQDAANAAVEQGDACLAQKVAEAGS